jgi:hypothetical protein
VVGVSQVAVALAELPPAAFVVVAVCVWIVVPKEAAQLGWKFQLWKLVLLPPEVTLCVCVEPEWAWAEDVWLWVALPPLPAFPEALPLPYLPSRAVSRDQPLGIAEWLPGHKTIIFSGIPAILVLL